MAPGVNSHLIVDAKSGGLAIASDTRSMWGLSMEWLRSMVKSADMKILDGPIIVKAEDGITGFVVIEESHISFHYWNSGRLHVDVFSCKTFDAHKMAKKIKQDWGCPDLQYHSQVLQRRVF